FVLAVITLGGAMTYPWSVTAQAALVVVATICLLPTIGTASANLIVAVLSAYGASIYAAAVFERRRLEHKAEELLRAGNEQVLELVASHAELNQVFDQLVRTIAQQVPSMPCTILILSPEDQCLHIAKAHGLPPDCRAALDGLRVGSGTDTFGGLIGAGKPF